MENLSQIMRAVGAEYQPGMDLDTQANHIAHHVMRSFEPITLPKPQLKLSEFKVYKKGYLPVYIPNAGSGGYMRYSVAKISSTNPAVLNNSTVHSHQISALAWYYNCWYDGFSSMKNFRYEDVTGAPLVEPHSIFKHIFTPGIAETRSFSICCGVYNIGPIKVKIRYDGGTTYYFAGFETGTSGILGNTRYDQNLHMPVGIQLGQSLNTIQKNKTSDRVLMLFDASFTVPETITASTADSTQDYQTRYTQNFSRYSGWGPKFGAFLKNFFGRAVQSAIDRSMSDWFDNDANVEDYADDITNICQPLGSSSLVDEERGFGRRNLWMMRYQNYSGTSASFDVKAFPCITFDTFYQDYSY